MRLAKFWVARINGDPWVWMACPPWWYGSIVPDKGFFWCQIRVNRARAHGDIQCLVSQEMRSEILGCTHQCWSLGLDSRPLTMGRFYRAWWGPSFGVTFISIGAMPMGIFYLRYDWIGMVAFPLHLYIKLDVSDPWMYRFACSVIETFYLQTFDIYWLFFLIFSAIAWPLQHG